MKPRQQSGGLTIVELLSCIAILSILLTLSIPSWKNTLEKYHAQHLQSQLRTLFHTARMEAVHGNTIVTLCPLDSSNRCSNDWNAEISVFLDPGNNRQLTTPDSLINTHKPSTQGLLKASSAGNSERRYFQYNPDGTVRGTIGHLIWCPNSLNSYNAFQLRINFGGRIRWARDENGDGYVQMANGNPVTC